MVSYLALGVPELPDAVLGAIDEVALRRNLAVLVVVAPQPLLEAVLVLAFGGDLAVGVELAERAVTNPAPAVRREILAVAELDFAALIADFRGLDRFGLGHGSHSSLGGRAASS